MKNRTVIIGEGNEKVLVLHDFFAGTDSYIPLQNYLDKKRYSYLFFDLRGYGRSKEIAGDYTLEEVTCDCIALVDQMGWEQFHAIGHSMTGLTIQELCYELPERVKSATAITPVPATGSPIPDDFLEVTREGIRGNDAIIKEIIAVASGNRYSDSFIEWKLRQFRESALPEARLGYLEMFSKSDISEKVRGLQTPYHVIVGECDSDWHSREAMEETFGKFYPNCRITSIRDASHFPMQETPILLASAIEAFFAECSPAKEPLMAHCGRSN